RRYVSETAERYCDRNTLPYLVAQRHPSRHLALGPAREAADAPHHRSPPSLSGREACDARRPGSLLAQRCLGIQQGRIRKRLGPVFSNPVDGCEIKRHLKDGFFPFDHLDAKVLAAHTQLSPRRLTRR